MTTYNTNKAARVLLVAVEHLQKLGMVGPLTEQSDLDEGGCHLGGSAIKLNRSVIPGENYHYELSLYRDEEDTAWLLDAYDHDTAELTTIGVAQPDVEMSHVMVLVAAMQALHQVGFFDREYDV